MDHEIEQELRDTWGRISTAMASNDAEALGALLAQDFVLGHMTGYQQPRREWLDDIASGATRYHSVRTEDTQIDDATPSGGVLTARTRTDVTIGGERGTWPTAFRVELARTDDGWVATYAEGSSW